MPPLKLSIAAQPVFGVCPFTAAGLTRTGPLYVTYLHTSSGTKSYLLFGCMRIQLGWVGTGVPMSSLLQLLASGLSIFYTPKLWLLCELSANPTSPPKPRHSQLPAGTVMPTAMLLNPSVCTFRVPDGQSRQHHEETCFGLWALNPSPDS